MIAQNSVQIEQSNFQFSLDDFQSVLQNGSNKKLTPLLQHLQTKTQNLCLNKKTKSQLYKTSLQRSQKISKIIQDLKQPQTTIKLDIMEKQFGQNDNEITEFIQQNKPMQTSQKLVPIRRKKNISQKTNQLVQILRALKNPKQNVQKDQNTITKNQMIPQNEIMRPTNKLPVQDTQQKNDQRNEWEQQQKQSDLVGDCIAESLNAGFEKNCQQQQNQQQVNEVEIQLISPLNQIDNKKQKNIVMVQNYQLIGKENKSHSNIQIIGQIYLQPLDAEQQILEDMMTKQTQKMQLNEPSNLSQDKMDQQQ